MARKSRRLWVALIGATRRSLRGYAQLAALMLTIGIFLRSRNGYSGQPTIAPRRDLTATNPFWIGARWRLSQDFSDDFDLKKLSFDFNDGRQVSQQTSIPAKSDGQTVSVLVAPTSAAKLALAGVHLADASPHTLIFRVASVWLV